MDDLISRQAAIKAVRKLYIKEPKINNDYAYNMGIDQADDAIRGLPSAERRGRWIKSKIENEKYVCSVCGGACWYYDYQGEVAKSKYCPNCGARMEALNED